MPFNLTRYTFTVSEPSRPIVQTETATIARLNGLVSFYATCGEYKHSYSLAGYDVHALPDGSEVHCVRDFRGCVWMATHVIGESE